jgi:hypothetical protein
MVYSRATGFSIGCLDSDGNCYFDSSADCDRTPDCPGINSSSLS